MCIWLAGDLGVGVRAAGWRDDSVLLEGKITFFNLYMLQSTLLCPLAFLTWYSSSEICLSSCLKKAKKVMPAVYAFCFLKKRSPKHVVWVQKGMLLANLTAYMLFWLTWACLAWTWVNEMGLFLGSLWKKYEECCVTTTCRAACPRKLHASHRRWWMWENCLVLRSLQYSEVSKLFFLKPSRRFSPY